MESYQQFLTFTLSDKIYAAKIEGVQEIRGWQEPKPLPNAPEYILGVIDFRSHVIPIIDLRSRFLLEATYSELTVVVVVLVQSSQGQRIIGLVVDAVNDVEQINMENIQPAPDILGAIDTQFILGLSSIFKQTTELSASKKVDETELNKGQSHMVIIVDLDKLFFDGLLDQFTSHEKGAS